MQHKWTYNNETFNFCIKCGCRKSYTWKNPCKMTNENWDLKLEHDIEGYEVDGLYKSYYYKRDPTKGKSYLDSFDKTEKKCSKCEVSSVYYVSSSVQWKNGKAYVPHTKETKNGIIHNKALMTKKIPKDKNGNPLKVYYWPIYCSYTKDDMDVQDIML